MVRSIDMTFSRKRMIFRLSCFIFALIVSVFPLWEGHAAESNAVRFKTVRLKAGNQTIHAEVATTEEERSQGLMYRKSLPKNSGMLFVFERPARSCMWMKNTLIPLSVAFIDHDGIIVNIEEMKPLTTDSHCSAGWIRYALEMNAKWFSKHGLKPGSRIEKLPD